MRSKFERSRDVLAAFPTLRDDMDAAVGEDPPLDFAQALLSGATPEDALTFLAYALPRRDAVDWCCRCVRRVDVVDDGVALAAAEDWARDPTEERRRRALGIADNAPSREPQTWAAYGAGWAGGNLSPDGAPAVLAAPHLTAKAVRAALLIAIALGPPKQRRTRLAECVDEVTARARTGDDSAAGVG